MSDASPFNGFPPDGLAFLAELAINNERSWFEPRKADYKRLVEAPAVALVAALGERLRALQPGIQYDLRANGSGSLMRLYRAVRFSKDKSPYNPVLRLIFWEGPGKKTAHPGFYIEIKPEGGGAYCGIYQFEPALLDAYRAAVDREKQGVALVEVLAALREAGYTVDGQGTKRVPAGFAPDHPRADLLRYRGLWAEHPLDPAQHTRPALVDALAEHCRVMLPFHRWLVEVERPLLGG